MSPAAGTAMRACARSLRSWLHSVWGSGQEQTSTAVRVGSHGPIGGPGHGGHHDSHDHHPPQLPRHGSGGARLLRVGLRRRGHRGDLRAVRDAGAGSRVRQGRVRAARRTRAADGVRHPGCGRHRCALGSHPPRERDDDHRPLLLPVAAGGFPRGASARVGCPRRRRDGGRAPRRFRVVGRLRHAHGPLRRDLGPRRRLIAVGHSTRPCAVVPALCGRPQGAGMHRTGWLDERRASCARTGPLRSTRPLATVRRGPGCA
ncbi:protein of unknown function [Microbacterium sp. Nx66]|nr:protein of unknown function [Microbacterium sp. Nx66]